MGSNEAFESGVTAIMKQRVLAWDMTQLYESGSETGVTSAVEGVNAATVAVKAIELTTELDVYRSMTEEACRRLTRFFGELAQVEVIS